MAKIETGVDKLVELVNTRKKISLDQAAKELGVSPLLVQEWADFLEDEKVIGLEYSLSRVFLVERKPSKKEVEHKAREYADKRDSFVSKATTAIASLEKETEAFERLKEQYGKYKREVSEEFAVIQEELKELRHYEELKKNLDADVARQRDEYTNLFDKQQHGIQQEEHAFQELLGTVKKELEQAEAVKGNLEGLRTQETALRARIKETEKILEALEERLVDENKLVDHAEQRVTRLHGMAASVEADIQRRRKAMLTPLLHALEENKRKVMATHDDLMGKMRKRREDIEKYVQQGTKLSEGFQKFLANKAETDNLFEEAIKEKLALERELQDLIDKAKGFHLLSAHDDLDKFVAELNTNYDKIQERKGALSTHITRLMHHLRAI